MVKNRAVKPVLRLLTLFIAAICTVFPLAGQTADEWFSRGLESFRRRKIDESSAFFLKAAETDHSNPDYRLYLAISYHRAGRFAEAEEAYGSSLSLGGDPDTVLLGRGNLRWSMGDTEGALSDYTRIIDGGGASTPSALLNRANLELSRGMYDVVMKDYTQYLALEPDAPDRETIERILALLNADIEAARMAEARRLADEARRAEEEARRQALMSEILESLRDSGEDTKSISAGSESIREEFEESKLEE